MHESCAVIPQNNPSGFAQSLKNTVCMAVTCCALAIILILAVPACLLILSISAVWNLADWVIRALE